MSAPHHHLYSLHTLMMGNLDSGGMALRISAAPKRQTLAQETEQILVKLLVEGRLQPGQKLQEEKLCRQLDTTRTPLREALRGLAARGLLEHQANRGYRVRPLGATDIVQLYQLREVLEALSAPHVLVRAMVASQQSKPLPPGPHSRHELVVEALAARGSDAGAHSQRHGANPFPTVFCSIGGGRQPP